LWSMLPDEPKPEPVEVQDAMIIPYWNSTETKKKTGWQRFVGWLRG